MDSHMQKSDTVLLSHTSNKNQRLDKDLKARAKIVMLLEESKSKCLHDLGLS